MISTKTAFEKHSVSIMGWRSFRRGSWVLLCVSCSSVFVVASGCGRRGPAVELVEGRLTIDGEPLSDAAVGFSPAGGGARAAHGRSDATGAFWLTSTEGGAELAGASIGDYIVTVRKMRNRVAELGPEPDRASDPRGNATYWSDVSRVNALPPESLIPVEYGERTTSPLRAEVKKGRNRFAFELSHSPPTGK